MDSLEEMDKFLERYNLPRVNQDEIENMNRPITSNEIETVIKNLPTGGQSQDCGLGGYGILVSEKPGHLPGTGGGPWTLKGMGGTHCDWVGHRVWGGVRREEKWRQDRTGAPEGQRGEGKGSHARRGKLGDHWEGRGSKGSVVRFPLPTWAPRSLLRSWA